MLLIWHIKSIVYSFSRDTAIFQIRASVVSGQNLSFRNWW